MGLGTIITVVAFCIIVEGLFISLFPKTVVKTFKYCSRSAKRMRNIALIELLIGVIVLIVGLLFQ